MLQVSSPGVLGALFAVPVTQKRLVKERDHRIPLNKESTLESIHLFDGFAVVDHTLDGSNHKKTQIFAVPLEISGNTVENTSV